MAIRHSLRFKLLLGSVLLLLGLFGVSSLLTVTYYGDRMTQQVVGSANRISDIVRQSTRYGMMLNRREDVHAIITTVGTEPGVEGIRIYNKRGEIMVSTDKREEFTVADLKAEACYACHEEAQPLQSLPAGNRTRIYRSAAGRRVLGVITPIRNESSCSSAPCHAHPEAQTVLGVLDVRLSLDETDAAIAEAERTGILIALGMILIVAPVFAWYFSSTVIGPLRSLMKGAREVAGGNLDHRIETRSKDELGMLAEAFNHMTASLRSEKEQNRQWAETLEEKIEEKTGELTEIHRRIVHVEKMASLGQLAATVAHELNNPLEAILTYARLVGRRLRRAGTEGALSATGASAGDSTPEDMDFIAQEANRCGTIVKNLLLFSKRQPAEFALVPADRIVERAAEIVRHHFEISSVRLEVTREGAACTVMCDEGQIQQALVALFVNAVEAMPGGGLIAVHIRPDPAAGEVAIRVTDTGTGISQETLPHIFEPFFTTKRDGKGTGLGLSVVYGIMERHGGRVTVASGPGRGSTFEIVLPRVPAPAAETHHDETYQTGMA